MPTLRLIAVILPTYNRAGYIVETLRSILSQRLPDSWQLAAVVVDDGSTDGTGEVLRAGFTDPRLHYIFQPNGERAIARNRGAKYARENLSADWLLFFDSDDILLPGSLEAYARGIDAQSQELSAIYSAIQTWNGEEPWPRRLLAKPRMPQGDLARRVLRSPLLPLGATLIRAETLQTLGGFNEDRHLIGSEDFELLIRIGLFGKISYLPLVTVLYRQHTQNTDPRNYLRSTDFALAILKTSVDKRWQGVEALRAYRVLGINCDLCRAGALNRPHFASEARKTLFLAFKKNPRLILYPRVWRLSASIFRTSLSNFVKALFPAYK